MLKFFRSLVFARFLKQISQSKNRCDGMTERPISSEALQKKRGILSYWTFYLITKVNFLILNIWTFFLLPVSGLLLLHSCPFFGAVFLWFLRRLVRAFVRRIPTQEGRHYSPLEFSGANTRCRCTQWLLGTSISFREYFVRIRIFGSANPNYVSGFRRPKN